MLELFPKSLPADPQDPGCLDPIALCEPHDRDDMLPLCLFPHLPERLVLHLDTTRFHNKTSCSRHGSYGLLPTRASPYAERPPGMPALFFSNLRGQGARGPPPGLARNGRNWLLPMLQRTCS